MVGIINLLFTAFTVAIFARVILSFVIPMSRGRPHPILVSANTLVNQVTEPILGPLRRMLPAFGGFDLSPMVALIIMWAIRGLVLSQL